MSSEKSLGLSVLSTIRDWVKSLISEKMDTSTYDSDGDGYVDAVEDTLNSGSGIEFSLDANGKGQYRATGASTWTPFLSGGGGVTETELWRNSSPTATFAEKDIWLSEELTDFDAIKIVWKGLNTQSATPDNYKTDPTALSVMYETYNLSSRTSENGQIFMATAYTATTYTYIRRVWIVTAALQGTSCIHIGPTQRTNNANSNAAYNIPLLICGVNFS